MAFRDIFDSDKRSKEELRGEIKRRDEQIARLLKSIDDLKARVDSHLPPADFDVAHLEAERVRSAELESEVDVLNTAVARLQELVRESGVREAELNVLVEQQVERRDAAERELQEEQRRRQEDSAKSRDEYQKLLDALNAVKQQARTVATSSTSQQAQAQTQPRDRSYFSGAHQVLMQREERIAAMAQEVDNLLARFGVTDKAQVVSLPARLEELERELETIRQGTDAQALLSLQDQLKAAQRISKLRTDECDELRRSLTHERQRNSTSEAERLRRDLDGAQIEIRQLRAGTSDEVWRLKRQAEGAEKKVQEREFEFRNLSMRVANLEHDKKLLITENSKLKINVVPLDIHQNACQRLELDARFQKDQAEHYKQSLERTEVALRAADSQVARLTQNLKIKGAKLAAGPTKGETSFSDPTVMRWLIEDGGPEKAGVPHGWAGRLGEGPWADAMLTAALEDLGYKFWALPDTDLRHLIVGRKGWSKEVLVEQIEAVDGEPLRIYSQEMFLAKLMTGRDPFDADDQELLLAFAKGHPALEFLISLPLPWPTISQDDNKPVEIVDGTDYGASESPLRLLGYQVGVTSPHSASERQRNLTEFFKAHELQFTPESSEAYKRKWGRGGSAQRLYRMATHIRWLANGQGNDPRKQQAQLEWINDLEWLRKTFYKSMRRRFQWP